MSGDGRRGAPPSICHEGRGGLTDLIELRGVSKVFGKGNAAVHAFGPVDLAIGEGQFVSFLGPSGCGKSTLMLMIAGLLEPSAGSILVNGKDVRGPQTSLPLKIGRAHV